MARNPKETILRMRGYLLDAIAGSYPGSVLDSDLDFILGTLAVNKDQLRTQLHYMQNRGWITMKEITLWGKERVQITATENGFDLAKGIDPEKPVFPEDN